MELTDIINAKLVDAVCLQGKKVDIERARGIAEKFNLKLTDKIPENKDSHYFLIDKTGITFIYGKQQLKGDFAKLLPRITNGHLQHEILLKVANQDAASQLGKLRAVDATAGLGEDAFILAAGGYRVEMFEHNPITAILLNDALIRAKNDGRLSEIARRMTFHEADSKQALKNLSYTPDLIYLDPMFPEKRNSAQAKAKLQMLHHIEEPCKDEKELLEAALQTQATKIIIKRPPGCEYLAGIKPNYSVERKAVRFDCLINSN